MRAAIYQINSKYIHSSLAPWYLCAAASDVCDSFVLEGSVNECDDVLFKKIADSACDVIGFCTYIWNVDTVLRIAERVREYNKNITVILGGPEVGYRAEQVLRDFPFVDYVISGEGEVPFASLLSCLRDGKHGERISGVCGREAGEIYVSEPYEMKEDPPCPYTDAYFDALHSRISYIETSRGCPFSCSYCLSCRQKLRLFDIDRARSDIMKLARSGSRTVKFVDRTFNADRRRALEILRFIIDKRECGEIPDNVTFHFEISGEIADGAFVDCVRQAPAGLFQFEIGVQSFNEATLRAINRSPNTERLCSVIRELSSFGNAHIHTDLIAGLPYEDIESFERSYNKLYALGSHKIQLGFLKLLHGSDMRSHPELYPCEYEASAPYKVKNTPWLSERDMQELECVERANDGIFFSGRFEHSVKYLLACTEKTPYRLCLELGCALYSDTTPPLDTLFCRLYEYASSVKRVDRCVLRDKLLYDRIETNNSCVIPQALKIKDTRLKALANVLLQRYPKPCGVRRSVGILYTENKVIFADYDIPNPVSGKYKVIEVPLCELEVDE